MRVSGAGGAYFQTMGIDLLRGRYFDRVEEERGLPLVIISQAAAELLFPGEDPLGKQVRPAAGNQSWFSVIGVVEDILIDDLRRESREPMVYLPTVSGSPAYVMRSARAEQLEAEVRAIVREVIPTSPMYRIFTMKRLAGRAMADLSFTMMMVSLAAVLALVLGAVGLYGVLSYRVTKRAQEIGVRMALGATTQSVFRMMIGDALRLVSIGVGAAGKDEVKQIYVATLALPRIGKHWIVVRPRGARFQAVQIRFVRSSSAGVPWNISRPPCSPAPGPRSIT